MMRYWILQCALLSTTITPPTTNQIIQYHIASFSEERMTFSRRFYNFPATHNKTVESNYNSAIETYVYRFHSFVGPVGRIWERYSYQPSLFRGGAV